MNSRSSANHQPTITTSHMIQSRRINPIVPITLAVLLVFVGSVVFYNFHASDTKGVSTGKGTTTLPTPTSVVAPLPKNIHLNLPPNTALGSLSMVTANDGWVVGSTRIIDRGGVQQPPISTYFYHWHDGAWQLTQTFPNIIIDSFAMDSSDDGWAVGGAPSFTSSPGSSIVLHYTDGKWQTATIPILPTDGSISPIRVYAPTANFLWIEAARSLPNTGNTQVLLLSYHDGTWKAIPTPFISYQSSVSMVGPDEGWAASSEQTAGVLSIRLYHLINGSWQFVTTIPGANAQIAMASANIGWIVSVSLESKGARVARPYIFDGKTWSLAQSTVTLPTSVNVASVIFTAIQGVLWYGVGDILIRGSMIGWQRQQLPQLGGGQLEQITSDGNGGLWALGELSDGLTPVIMYDVHNTWAVYGTQ